MTNAIECDEFREQMLAMTNSQATAMRELFGSDEALPYLALRIYEAKEFGLGAFASVAGQLESRSHRRAFESAYSLIYERFALKEISDEQLVCARMNISGLYSLASGDCAEQILAHLFDVESAYWRAPEPSREASSVAIENANDEPWLEDDEISDRDTGPCESAPQDSSRPDSGESVYFVQNPSSGLIKIGFTTNFTNRLKGLECGTGEKLVVLLRLSGGRSYEKEHHLLFSRYRKCGEWFEPSDELLTYIRERQTMGLLA